VKRPGGESGIAGRQEIARDLSICHSKSQQPIDY
jgi:hypothetical protein